MGENIGIVLYANLLSNIKIHIRQAQIKATYSANAEMNQDIYSFLPQPVGKFPSECELTRALPETLKSSLLGIEELKAELGGIYQE